MKQSLAATTHTYLHIISHTHTHKHTQAQCDFSADVRLVSSAALWPSLQPSLL